MATLARDSHLAANSQNVFLTSSVPQPFSSQERDHIFHDQLLEELAREQVDYGLSRADLPSHPQLDLPMAETSQPVDDLRDILPSIAQVQRSCIMALNNLLSNLPEWQPIIPDRRHSVPLSFAAPASESAQSCSALQTLVHNLRSRDADNHSESSDTITDGDSLFRELRVRVDTLMSTLAPDDAEFVQVLVSLLLHFRTLSRMRSPAFSDDSDFLSSTLTESTSPADLFDMLKRQLSDLQLERLANHARSTKGRSPIQAVETALLWSKIDEELETVFALCKKRTESLPWSLPSDHLPPRYEWSDYAYDTPPEYDSDGARSSLEVPEGKAAHGQQPASPIVGSSEKMRLDFEAVTMAIDRLYMVAPQLHDQRAELKSTKPEQTEKARRVESHQASSSMAKGKNKQADDSDFDHVIELLGKASQRRLMDQSVVIEGDMKSRIEKMQQRNERQREAFVEQLMQHSGAGRYHTQDAAPPSPKLKDLDALVSVSEFIMETAPDEQDGCEKKPSLHPSLVVDERHPSPFGKKSRNRSMSAPSLQWLRLSSKSTTKLALRARKSASRPNSSIERENTDIDGYHVDSSLDLAPLVPLEVAFLAEYHETLQHILVFVTVPDLPDGDTIDVEVLPSPENEAEGNKLVVSHKERKSSPMNLPVCTTPGWKEVVQRAGNFEVKLRTDIPPTHDEQPASGCLMDASVLTALKPTSFVCASCSLPVVRCSRIEEYRDLPSEHWAELVDAWMCHTDQKLHEHVAKYGQGFWPQEKQALVGGSYILFEGSSAVKANITTDETMQRQEDWHLVRCLCGAIHGRCQERTGQDGTLEAMFRLLKYAVRPVGPATEIKFGLSSFIVEDMCEFVQAHATYRFVISDEEMERPRILIWLFRPSMRLAYVLPSSRFLPMTESIHVAKVLYKVVGPTLDPADLPTALAKYPGFPQAEYLSYPLDICRRLENLLRESTRTYPETMRTMTNLDVGWLQRA